MFWATLQEARTISKLYGVFDFTLTHNQRKGRLRMLKEKPLKFLNDLFIHFHFFKTIFCNATAIYKIYCIREIEITLLFDKFLFRNKKKKKNMSKNDHNLFKVQKQNKYFFVFVFLSQCMRIMCENVKLTCKLHLAYTDSGVIRVLFSTKDPPLWIK